MIDKEEADLIKYCHEYFNVELKENADLNAFKILLQHKINDLLVNNFKELIQVLYRVDVAEIKLKRLLNENKGKDAALIIADLIIERLQQKINSRNQFKMDIGFIPDDEKW